MMSPTTLLRFRLAGAVALVLSALGGCSSFKDAGSSMSTLGGVITPYKMDIVQGNVVTREQVEALQPGMPRDQVRAILGTPLLASLFHSNRWDYVFTFNRQGQEPQERKVVVFFKDDLVERVEADKLPSEIEFVAALDSRAKPGDVPVLDATPEALKAFDEKNVKAPKTAAATPETPPPATSYPPLETR
ncbi:MAG TPA: outer membrane protein assembly factor BamE [Macromonas sp.]|nr:outer membrane protein assembly factor BamE [Macromonas sp.]